VQLAFGWAAVKEAAMKLMKFLLGLAIGAGVALLFAPKSGRALREQLIGGAAGKMLPAAPVEFPQPEHERDWAAATIVAEEPPETAVAEVPVESPAGMVGELGTQDLKARIDETRAAVENEIAQPFAAAEAVEEAEIADVVAEETAVEAVAAEIVAEEALAEAEIAEAVAEEAVAEAVIAEAVAEEAVADAVIAEAVAEEAVAEAVIEEAVAEEAVIEEAVAEEVVAEAVIDEAVAEEVVITDAAVVEEALAVEEMPVVEEIPVVEETPVAEAMPAREPNGLVADLANSSTGEAPPTEVPVAEPASAEPPAGRENGSIDQAEMRRRIEETRARLKAKAFDAMMSGEAALLSRDSGENAVPTGDEVKLDAETDSTIDESLSQEDY